MHSATDAQLMLSVRDRGVETLGALDERLWVHATTAEVRRPWLRGTDDRSAMANDE